MPRRAHNSKLPKSICYQEKRFFALSQLYSDAHPASAVSFSTFTSRVRTLYAKQELTTERLQDALYLAPNEYREKFGVRKTWIEVDSCRLDLQDFHKSSASTISYRVVWQRVRALKRSSTLDSISLGDALAMPTPDWIAFYGGGRHRAFVYEGEACPQHSGKHFHSIAAFLRTVDRYNQKATIWSRLKNSWNIDDALTVPVTSESKRKGLIYRLLRRKTSQVYVGLTLGTLDQRWVFHVRSAKAGATTKLAIAIREDGPAGFERTVLESNISGLDVLASRERFWTQKLGALGSQGLNTAQPGGLGGPRGKRIEIDGESFRSLDEAAQLLGERLDLPSYVVRSRIAKGLPIPKKARKHAQHEDAGTNLYRRWLALVRRHPTSIVARWKESYEMFKADVQPFDPAHRLVRRSDAKPWGPKNFEWVDTKTAVERRHGKRISAFGVTYPSLKAVSEHFGIGISTLKDRIGRQGLSIEAALKEPLSNTSYRRQSAPVVDGRTFRSKRQAILYLAESRGWTEDQAKYRFTVGKFE